MNCQCLVKMHFFVEKLSEKLVDQNQKMTKQKINEFRKSYDATILYFNRNSIINFYNYQPI